MPNHRRVFRISIWLVCSLRAGLRMEGKLSVTCVRLLHTHPGLPWPTTFLIKISSFCGLGFSVFTLWCLAGISTLLSRSILWDTWDGYMFVVSFGKIKHFLTLSLCYRLFLFISSSYPFRSAETITGGYHLKLKRCDATSPFPFLSPYLQPHPNLHHNLW